MAVNAVIKETKLKLQLDGGLNEKGNPVVKSKTFSKVKTDAVNDNLFSVAESLAGLQEMPLIGIKRVDEIDLQQE
ncbi:DUF1659 domain-containing protein [Proteiniborus sp. MB09-C3]|uniref:DUF1659 domain-containing protein n=1 Tax=Proteiniborus sp. MB09-C3 TaxID=3050072 RepID=UPI002556E4C7|nr:DUF1659 domain-containing protein [Proteiniborus sp. MB09-C3]WIV12061.1 DUF1659 domain-containing protein [Proteiniborus sp. MB09-C3]